MKWEIRNASYRPFIDNESTSLTMIFSTYFEFSASLLMKWEAYVGTYLLFSDGSTNDIFTVFREVFQE